MNIEPEKRPVVAIIDDETDIRLSVGALLHENGFDTLLLNGSADFRALGPQPEIDLALIDLKLDGESGLLLAKNIRAQFDMPIIILTGVGDAIDKIIGLETGADDYVMKPFNPRELVARIRAVLRRYGVVRTPQSSPLNSDPAPLMFGRKKLDRKIRQLLDEEGNEVALTNAEYRLLEFFLRNPDRIISRPELLEELGSDLTHYIDRTIDVLILRLRRKIEPVPSKPMHVQTRRGQGYVFIPDPEGLQ